MYKLSQSQPHLLITPANNRTDSMLKEDILNQEANRADKFSYPIQLLLIGLMQRIPFIQNVSNLQSLLFIFDKCSDQVRTVSIVTKEKKWQSGDKQAQVCRNLVKSMLADHQRQDITFNQLISLLARHNAKFYSPDEFKKMSKLFTHPHKVQPIGVPLKHIKIHSVMEGLFPLYLIKVQNKPNGSHSQVISPFMAMNTHPPQACVRSFVVIMRRRFGNQINWFKVLGGITLSVTISTNVFQENAAQVLLSSHHKKCAKKITLYFKQQSIGAVSWKKFMAIVKQEIKSIQTAKLNQFTLAPKTSQTVFLPSPKKSLAETQYRQKRSERQSLDLTIRNNTQNKSYYKEIRTNSNEKRFIKSSYVSSNCRAKTQESFQLLLQNKKCKIFERTHTAFSEKERDQESALKVRDYGMVSKKEEDWKKWGNKKKSSIFFQENNKSCYV